jgi:hypothetical protein
VQLYIPDPDCLIGLIAFHCVNVLSKRFVADIEDVAGVSDNVLFIVRHIHKKGRQETKESLAER